jgi:hypothetical protein
VNFKLEFFTISTVKVFDYLLFYSLGVLDNFYVLKMCCTNIFQSNIGKKHRCIVFNFRVFSPFSKPELQHFKHFNTVYYIWCIFFLFICDVQLKTNTHIYVLFYFFIFYKKNYFFLSGRVLGLLGQSGDQGL